MILSQNLTRNLRKTNIEPIIVLEIDGVPFLLGSGTINRYPRYGDEGLNYGMPNLRYGTPTPIPGQKTLISLDGTTTQIRQILNPDKARATGVTQMNIRLVDKNLEATKIAAGAYGEILYKSVKVWISFGVAAWREDFIIIFRGIVESVSSEQGAVMLLLNSPQQKQRQLLAPKVETELDGAINNAVTTITLLSVDNLLNVPISPFYAGRDPALKTFVRINNEIIEYTGITGNQITGCARAQLGTFAASHADEDAVESLYELEGNAMDLALKIMLSDKDMTDYIIDLPFPDTNTDGTGFIANSFFLPDLNLRREYNVSIGDYVKTSGYTNGANNLATYTEILDVVTNDLGSYIIVDAPLVNEVGSSGVISFLSRWNTLGEFGLKLNTDELDIERHINLRNSFLTDNNLRFFIRDEIEDAREWIEKELYLVCACYSLPSDRNGLSRLSVGIHKPPIPGTNIVRIDRDNIINPDKLSIKRSINKYYYNAIVFKYEDQPLDDELKNRVITVPGTLDIPTGTKALVIESQGLKDFYNAKTLGTTAGNRLLTRYRSAAESIDNLKVHFGVGVQVSVGDIVIVDPTDLNLIDNQSESRNKPPLLMEVVNRSVDIKTGDVKLEVIDTSFNIDARFGLISPSSLIASVISPTQFVITFINAGGQFGFAEYRKWDRLRFPGVTIRNEDFSDVHYTRVLNVSSNTITIETAPSFTLASDYIMEFSPYSDIHTTEEQKLVYAYFTDDDNNFSDGGLPYVFI